MSSVDDSTITLFVRKAEKLPRPFDPHIASIKLWSDSNSAENGYNAILSADFGSDIISLNVGRDTVEVLCEILQAEVVLDFPHSEPTLGSGYFEHFGGEFVPLAGNHESSSENSKEVAIEVSFNPSARFSQQLKKSSRSDGSEGKSIMPFTHPQLETIKVGNWRSDRALEGPQIQNYAGWRVNPLHAHSGTLARLNVRKNWVKFSKPNVTKAGKLRKLVSNLTKSGDPFDRLKLQLFPSLLKELVFLRLQRPDRQKTATLAAAGLVIEGENPPVHIEALSGADSIVLPDHQLLRLLNCPPGTERETRDQIVAEAMHLKRSAESLFRPTASYAASLDAYLDIRAKSPSEQSTFERPELDRAYGGKTISALSVLGLLMKTSGGTVRLVDPFPGTDPTRAFNAVVKRQSTIRTAENYVTEFPDATVMEVGQAISGQFGLNWSPKSCQRYGHQIKSWARLEGNSASGIGAPSAIGDSQISHIKRMVRNPTTTTAIADQLGISKPTLSKWRKSGKNTIFSKQGPWKLLDT